MSLLNKQELLKRCLFVDGVDCVGKTTFIRDAYNILTNQGYTVKIIGAIHGDKEGEIAYQLILDNAVSNFMAASYLTPLLSKRIAEAALNESPDTLYIIDRGPLSQIVYQELPQVTHTLWDALNETRINELNNVILTADVETRVSRLDKKANKDSRERDYLKQHLMDSVYREFYKENMDRAFIYDTSESVLSSSKADKTLFSILDTFANEALN